MDFNKLNNSKSDSDQNENQAKVPWYRRKRRKDSKDKEKYESRNFFFTLRHWRKEIKSNQSNKVKSVENLNPPEDLGAQDSNEDFARLFINPPQNPIVFSSPTTDDSTQDYLFSESTVRRTNEEPVSIPQLSQEAIATTSTSAHEPVPVQQPPSENIIPEAAGIVLMPAEEDFDEMLKKIKVDLMKYSWYWPNLSRVEAQKKLAGKANGSFLIRDSTTEKKFTLSFRSSGVTLHCRIEYKDKLWSYIENNKSSSIEALIESNIEQSKSSIIGFVKQNSQLYPPFAVRLSSPINRCVPSLQDICISCIKSQVAANDINNVTKLPLPSKIKEFVKDNFNTL